MSHQRAAAYLCVWRRRVAKGRLASRHTASWWRGVAAAVPSGTSRRARLININDHLASRVRCATAALRVLLPASSAYECKRSLAFVERSNQPMNHNATNHELAPGASEHRRSYQRRRTPVRKFV